MQEKAFFIGFILFFVWIAGSALVIYLVARTVHIEGNSIWRAFVAALASGFALWIVVSVARGSIGANLWIWTGLYAVIALPVIRWALRTTFAKAIVPWLGAVICLGVAFLAWYFLPSILTVG